MPNILTISRAVLGIFVYVLAVRDYWGGAFAVLVVAIATDWLDGYLANIKSQSTKFGELVDPLTDLILVAFSIGGLLATHTLTWKSMGWIALPAPFIWPWLTWLSVRRHDWPLHRFVDAINVLYFLSVLAYVAWLYAEQALGQNAWMAVTISVPIVILWAKSGNFRNLKKWTSWARIE